MHYVLLWRRLDASCQTVWDGRKCRIQSWMHLIKMSLFLELSFYSHDVCICRTAFTLCLLMHNESLEVMACWWSVCCSFIVLMSGVVLCWCQFDLRLNWNPVTCGSLFEIQGLLHINKALPIKTAGLQQQQQFPFPVLYLIYWVPVFGVSVCVCVCGGLQSLQLSTLYERCLGRWVTRPR